MGDILTLLYIVIYFGTGAWIVAGYTWEHRKDRDWEQPRFWWFAVMFTIFWLPYMVWSTFRDA